MDSVACRPQKGAMRWAVVGFTIECAGKPKGSVAMEAEEIARRIQYLRQEHRDLDAAIAALGAGSSTDQLQIARLKKRKLRLRDEIALLEDQLIPDIIA